MSTLFKNKYKYKNLAGNPIRVSIVVSIPACHAGDRGSIPRHGELFYIFPESKDLECLSTPYYAFMAQIQK